MVNLNRLFPRLSIRAKLAIGFVFAAVVPLIAISAIGTRETVRQIERTARMALEYDLRLAETSAARSLAAAEGHVRFLADVVFAPLLSSGRLDAVTLADVGRTVADFIATEPSLFRVKLIDADGVALFVGGRDGRRPATADANEAGAMLYAWRAQSMAPRQQLLLPIELAGDSGAAHPTPAVAILIPIHDADGNPLGVVVGEAYASVLFGQFESGSPELSGVTGLVDADGLFLYHSVRKRHWARLLATRDEVNLHADFPAEITAAMLSGERGTVVSPTGSIVSYRPLDPGGGGLPRLTLYRAIPLERLAQPVRRFLQLVGSGGVAVVVLVIGAAMLAADQFTKPIYRVRDAAWRLARGESDVSVVVETNDEFEDLAKDFTAVARVVSEHRHQRETLIAERTRALAETHAELADVLTHSADAIIGLDPTGAVRVWNRGAEALFGYATAEAMQRPIEELIGPRGPGAERELAFVRRELERHGAIVNLRGERGAKDGSAIPVTITQTLMADEHGHPLGASLIIRDNRVQARLEEHMRRSERLAAVSVMAAGLAHELNNPLAIIGNRIELMQGDVRDRWPDTSLAKDLDVLNQHVARLGGITTDLLRFAREDRDVTAPVSLSDIVCRVCGLLERTLVTRGLRLETSAPNDLPPLAGSEKAIETVLVNLLLNAADATPRGGVVAVEVRRAAGGAEALQLEVRDTGAGVPAELQAQIFEPFFTTKDPGRGTGLGLTVCRTIVDRHGGSIRVESEVAGGSRFIVTLPLEPMVDAWKERAFS